VWPGTYCIAVVTDRLLMLLVLCRCSRSKTTLHCSLRGLSCLNWPACDCRSASDCRTVHLLGQNLPMPVQNTITASHHHLLG
jgi:hypothetical protein